MEEHHAGTESGGRPRHAVRKITPEAAGTRFGTLNFRFRILRRNGLLPPLVVFEETRYYEIIKKAVSYTLSYT
jgi:hypothetical protein